MMNKVKFDFATTTKHKLVVRAHSSCANAVSFSLSVGQHSPFFHSSFLRRRFGRRYPLHRLLLGCCVGRSERSASLVFV